jgi:lipopolysaccharide/colanic/teichoic acid biosynthesis glycosyltransferase
MASDFNMVALVEERPTREARHLIDIRQGCSPPLTKPTKAIYVIDFCLAVLFLIAALPLLLIAALAVKLSSRGKVIYCQTRTGQGGMPYTIYKIRTMYANCESLSGVCWSSKGDPRITPVGRVLRRLHLDEIPQLWNVLRGEMSLVGPRPERPEFVVKLQQLLPDYERRLLVRPGLTGLAQVQLPADIDLEGVRRKLACDLYYVDNRTLWLDARILICTASKILGIPFAIPRTLLRMPTGTDVDSVRILTLDQGEQVEFLATSFSSVS